MRGTPTLVALAAALACCGRAPVAPTSEDVSVPATITVTSPALEAGGPIPTLFTEDGEDVSPPLEWAGIPAGARELALIFDDPDAPSREPWAHWVVYGLPPDSRGVPRAVAPGAPMEGGGLQGMNSWGTPGYRGPAPPRGHGIHRYRFRVYALDAPTGLGEGADRAALFRAMRGRVLASGELVGTYGR